MKNSFLRLLAMLSIVALPFMASAQSTLEDVVYLKNGSVIHGTIVEQVPNVSIKIKTADGNLFVFRIEEVEKITKEEKVGANAPKERGVRHARGGFGPEEMKQRGYSATAELVTAIGYNDFPDKSSFGMQVINGYQVNPYFNAGVGVGLNQHFSGAAFMPVFLDLRGTFLRQRVSPFVGLAGGWAVALNVNDAEPDEGGLYLNPAFGVRFFVSRKTSLNLSVGLRYQEGTGYEREWDIIQGNYVERNERIHRNAFTLRFGVTF
ncbi:MAG: hypothetical protein IPJ76_14030 [Flavobacteriales bacterium]|nr:MAG: hypothetical protein IPJ76_14030 [Flavobacteriales bacterium]